ncbi:hypothetical protein TWF506_008095 [Arthrobotrys conoides]|uniref:Uncharacterized protein n=1 Tax=Arthrobotrys conoides TaxID=74498 RepID=A0AAN8N8T5_9PEZI
MASKSPSFNSSGLGTKRMSMLRIWTRMPLLYVARQVKVEKEGARKWGIISGWTRWTSSLGRPSNYRLGERMLRKLASLKTSRSISSLGCVVLAYPRPSDKTRSQISGPQVTSARTSEAGQTFGNEFE